MAVGLSITKMELMIWINNPWFSRNQFSRNGLVDFSIYIETNNKIAENEIFKIYKRTVSLILKYPSMKKWQCPIYNGILKPLSIPLWIKYPCFCFCELFIFICAFLAYRCYAEIIKKKNTFLVRKTTLSQHFWSD